MVNSLTVLVLLLFVAVVALALTVWSALAVGRRRVAEPVDEPYRARSAERPSQDRPRDQVAAPVAKRTVVSPPRGVAEPKTSQPPIDFADPPRAPAERPATPRGPAGSARDQAGSPHAQVGSRRDQAPPPADPPAEIRPGRSGRTVREPTPGPAAGEPDQRPSGVSVRPRVVVTEAEPPRAPRRPEPDHTPAPPTNETPRATVKPREVEPNAFDRFIDAERRRN